MGHEGETMRKRHRSGGLGSIAGLKIGLDAYLTGPIRDRWRTEMPDTPSTCCISPMPVHNMDPGVVCPQVTRRVVI